jgi:hypothetical protein
MNDIVGGEYHLDLMDQESDDKPMYVVQVASATELSKMPKCLAQK